MKKKTLKSIAGQEDTGSQDFLLFFIFFNLILVMIAKTTLHFMCCLYLFILFEKNVIICLFYLISATQ